MFVAGVDFPGWVHFPHHRVWRTVTKKRMIKKLVDAARKPEMVASYRIYCFMGTGIKLAGIVSLRLAKTTINNKSIDVQYGERLYQNVLNYYPMLSAT